mmetsp:Transcript_37061/g.75952  ORF Transcript_37061/g.75952 Transcript_37061/m.75952 type:complete len:83 (+) Transcript_37061:1149-1397(+)
MCAEEKTKGAGEHIGRRDQRLAKQAFPKLVVRAGLDDWVEGLHGNVADQDAIRAFRIQAKRVLDSVYQFQGGVEALPNLKAT